LRAAPTGKESTVIDVGRSKRLVDGSLRKALAIRDQHCQWPEVRAPGFLVQRAPAGCGK